jgi:bifunctional non-homologous end joining protein LigD
MVLDGEMVITDENGRTDFQALQNYIKHPRGKALTYIVFDLLALDGEDLRNQPLIRRKEKLEKLIKNAPDNLRYSKHVKGKGEESFRAACSTNLEGIVGKRADSVYSGTRNGDWIKLKCDTRQEFVIGGYTLSDKKTSGVSSLLLGVFEGKDFVYLGRAGTGLTVSSMKELEEKFQKIKRDTPPFKEAPGPKKNEKIIWLNPELVAEIKFAEWTEDHLLRQGSFKGLRTDKAPRDVRRETPEDEIQPEEKPKKKKSPARELEEPMKANGDGSVIEGVKISSPDKVLFTDPEVTKADVVRYYQTVSERMLPYVSNRILSIVRCPQGMAGACFFKKHPGPDSEGIVTVPVPSSSGGTEDYFYITDAAGLIHEVQMNTLEFHTWGSRADNLEKPDMMVFDLDPDEGMDLQRVREGVKDLKSLLDELSLVTFLKTSGGKGYHVVIPFKPSVAWDPFHDFARSIAEAMEQKWPDRYTSNVRKEKRKGKIFIDWIRNGRGATSIAPYSIRARKGARVSMPVTWKELDTVAPDEITMAEAVKRLRRKDPWADFYQTDQRLK